MKMFMKINKMNIKSKNLPVLIKKLKRSATGSSLSSYHHFKMS